MRDVALTVDYEIFGNGTGDVIRHVVEPAERMARLCERHRMPLTVFFEAEEYVAFAQRAAVLRNALGYDPAALMRTQVAELIGRGHDVQLHLHPEWKGASYENGQWRLRVDKPTVDSLFESQAETTRYIAERKALLEEMFRGVAPRRKVCAYRAGAFRAQPGTRLLAALADNGFVLDSSVVPGLHQTNGPGSYDYRQAPRHKRLWRVGRNVAEEDPGGRVWEIPIHSVMRRRLHQATWGRLRAKFSRHVPKERQRQMVRELGLSRNPIQLARFLWQPVPIKLDFHNVSPGKLLQWIRSLPPPAAGELDAVVLIGHTKEHADDRAFARFLEGVASDETLRVVSLHDLAGKLEASAPERGHLGRSNQE